MSACSTAIAMAYACGAAPALAQGAEGASAGAEIIVTAQRRAESLQDVPVSLTVVGEDALNSRNINEAGDLTLAAPSLQSGSDNQFAIRGVGTVAFSDTLESSVATSIDDVNIGRSFGAGSLFNDVARVEVLSGPQGLLFGKNASAGLLNIVTKKPEFGYFGGNVDFEAVTRDTTPGNGMGVNMKGVLNVPVGQTTALRFDGFYSYQEPVGVFVGSGTADENLRAYGIRGKFLTEFGEGWSIYVIGDYNERHGIAGSFDRTFRELGEGSGVAPILEDEGITPSKTNFYYAGEGDFHRDEKSGGAQAKVAYELANGWEISNIAAVRFSKRDQSLDTDLTDVQQLSINWRKSKYDQFSNELRVAIPDTSRLNGQFGIYYLTSKLDSTGQLAGFTGLPAGFISRFPFCVGSAATVAANCPVARDYFIGGDSTYTLKERNLAGFGQLFYKVTDSLQLLAGARVTDEHLSIDTVQNQMALYFVNLGVTDSFKESYDHTSFSWKFGGQYNITPDIMVYTTYGKGRKGAGFNDRATQLGQKLLVEPEDAKSLEAGIKTSWFDKKLIFNVGLYHTKFSNYQVQSLDTVAQTFIIQNAATLTTKGAEFTVLAKPFPGLSINGSATLQKAVFGDFLGAQCNPGQSVPCGADGTYNAKGTELPTAPRFAGTIQAMYEGALTDSLDYFIESNLYHRSALNYRVGEPAITRVGPIDVLGASIGLKAGSTTFRIFCKNCTDKRVPAFLNPDAGDANAGIASSIQQWNFKSVRNIGISLETEF
ncbi:hypothetical protein JI59_21790 (plasmid) [Novosphingobium pentaromativorans US6-1]|nr:hypothetical protein JI59_21790 [Novosphingobium pentaromativorans US6-1]